MLEIKAPDISVIKAIQTCRHSNSNFQTPKRVLIDKRNATKVKERKSAKTQTKLRGKLAITEKTTSFSLSIKASEVSLEAKLAALIQIRRTF